MRAFLPYRVLAGRSAAGRCYPFAARPTNRRYLRSPDASNRPKAAVPDVAIAARLVRRLRLRTGSWLSCLASNFSSCVAAAYGRPKLASSPETEQFGRSRMPRWSVGQWKVSRRDESCSPVSKRFRASFRARRRSRGPRTSSGCSSRRRQSCTGRLHMVDRELKNMLDQCPWRVHSPIDGAWLS